MMKHTPGPWWVEAGKYFRAIRSSEQVVADMRMVDNFCKEADANLIAAAPELLSALSQLIDAAVGVYDGQSEDFPELVKATEKACAVYAKATGT